MIEQHPSAGREPAPEPPPRACQHPPEKLECSCVHQAEIARLGEERDFQRARADKWVAVTERCQAELAAQREEPAEDENDAAKHASDLFGYTDGQIDTIVFKRGFAAGCTWQRQQVAALRVGTPPADTK